MQIIELQSHQPHLIQQALEIYEGAFPEEERVPAEELVRAIAGRERPAPEDPQVFHFQAAVVGEDVLGMAIFTYYRPTRMAFIPYLAVHPQRRNSGLGSKIYQHLVTTTAADGNQADGQAIGVTFEVERPELGKGEAEREIRRRRIGFYQRIGAILVPHLYLVAPPLGAGLPEMAYEIMLHPLDCQLPLGRSATEAVVETVLGHGYGLPAENPFYQRALASIDL